VVLSTFALQAVYPQAKITGLDLSPYFLAVANYRTKQRRLAQINWVHDQAESTDMNPKSENYKKMPTYILTLLKSTEPYLDEYFSLDIEQALIGAGLQAPTITSNSPRYRTIIAQVSG
jgi:hypothetical protein